MDHVPKIEHYKKRAELKKGRIKIKTNTVTTKEKFLRILPFSKLGLLSLETWK